MLRAGAVEAAMPGETLQKVCRLDDRNREAEVAGQATVRLAVDGSLVNTRSRRSWTRGLRIPATSEGWTPPCRSTLTLDREIILGVTFVGPAVGELSRCATIAIVGEVLVAHRANCPVAPDDQRDLPAADRAYVAGTRT